MAKEGFQISSNAHKKAVIIQRTSAIFKLLDTATLTFF